MSNYAARCLTAVVIVAMIFIALAFSDMNSRDHEYRMEQLKHAPTTQGVER
jgi:hypothetical protein